VPDYAIVAHQVERSFKEGQVRALDGVSLNVPVGQVFGLLGPNGSGKTTMVRILATILKPTAGSVEILGHDVVRSPEKIRPLIGLAGQFATVDENLTGFENLRMMGRLNHLESSVIGPRCHALLEQFGLGDAGSRSAKTYSGGMRRRLDLAAALVATPPLLFLDEPTTGLDPQSRQDLWAVIESLVEGGTTVFLTTQYLEEADRLAKQLVVLDHGKVIAEGTPAQLKAQLGTTVLALTFATTDDANRGAQLVRDLSAQPLNIDGTVVELTVNAGPSVAVDALRRIDGSGVNLSGLSLREPSLDDVFLSLTGHKTDDDSASPTTSPTTASRGRS
jgi:ABC-2 type transport system ATP-binding protein